MPQLLTSQTLLLRLRDLDDQAAWKEFVERYAPSIYGWCRFHQLSQADAADVTQDVLYKLVSAIQSFRYDSSRGRFRSWLKTVTRNALRDYVRESKRAAQGTGDTATLRLLSEVGDQRFEDELAALVEAEAQHELLKSAEEQVQTVVSPHTWQAYVLTVHEKCSARDAAARLNLRVTDVYVAKSRVISRLKQLVQSQDSTLVN